MIIYTFISGIYPTPGNIKILLSFVFMLNISQHTDCIYITALRVGDPRNMKEAHQNV